LQKVI